MFYVGQSIANARILQNNSDLPMFIFLGENLFNYATSRQSKDNFDTKSVKQTINNLVAHEISHTDHMSLRPQTDKTIIENFLASENYLMLYMEGVAEYAKTKINNIDDTDFNDLTGYDYSSVTKDDIPILATEFLKIYNQKSIDNGFVYWDVWLSKSKDPIAGKMYPNAIGYFLGYFVVKDCIERKNIDFDSFLSHEENDPYIKQEIYDSLVYLSKQYL